MANKHYHLIDQLSIELYGVKYECSDWYGMTLKDILEIHFDKEIYIYSPSIQTNEIKAIVI